MTFQRKKINREHKDMLFHLIFENKEDLMTLYNAVNKTEYTNVEDLQITTLNDAVYMSMKNDVSFLFENKMNLYEHQSTFNPNMPIRGFEYFAELYSTYMEQNHLDVYGSTQVKLPTPQYIVFYNGTKEQPERSVLKLSDAFEKKADNGFEPCIEVEVVMLNINLGYNQMIMEKCRKLKEYAQLISLVRKHIDEGMSIEIAMDMAVDEAIANDILKDILVKNRAEVIMNFIYEYDEERHIKNERALAREEGIGIGREEGIAALILDNLEEGVSAERIVSKLQKRFQLTEDMALKYLKKYSGK